MTAGSETMAAGAVAQAGAVMGASTALYLGHLDAASLFLIVVAVCTARASAVALDLQRGSEKWTVLLAMVNLVYMSALVVFSIATILVVGEGASLGWRLLIAGGYGWLGPIALATIGDRVKDLINRLFGSDLPTRQNRPPAPTRPDIPLARPAEDAPPYAADALPDANPPRRDLPFPPFK